jgi:carboxypeptidase PM20D1
MIFINQTTLRAGFKSYICFMKSLYRFFLFGLFGLGALLIAKTITFSSRQIAPPVAELEPLPEGFEAGLSMAWQDSAIYEQFPKALSQLQIERIGKNGCLLKWPGKQAKLNPVLLLGRLKTGEKTASAVMEAVDWLVAEGYYPERTLLLAFGDEDSDRAISLRLKELDIRPEFILAGGSYLVRNAIASMPEPLAAIAIAEKGLVTFSAPLDSQALSRIRDNPFPGSLRGPAGQLLDYLGPEMNGLNRLILANRWLFGPLLLRRLSAKPSSNAMIRSLAEPVGDSLLQVRIRPGESIASCKAFLEKIIENPQTPIYMAGGSLALEPPPVSPTEAFGFQVLQKTVGEIFPGAITVPAISEAGSDSRHYRQFSQHFYRFTPLIAGVESIAGDQSPSLEEYARMVRFYRQLIRNSCP